MHLEKRASARRRRIVIEACGRLPKDITSSRAERPEAKGLGVFSCAYRRLASCSNLVSRGKSLGALLEERRER